MEAQSSLVQGAQPDGKIARGAFPGKARVRLKPITPRKLQ
jgi:hypothetical protein